MRLSSVPGMHRAGQTAIRRTVALNTIFWSHLFFIFYFLYFLLSFSHHPSFIYCIVIVIGQLYSSIIGLYESQEKSRYCHSRNMYPLVCTDWCGRGNVFLEVWKVGEIERTTID